MNTATILSIDYEGRGVARPNGKTTFIHNALPLETVSFRYTQQKKQFDEGQCEHIIHASPSRVQAACRFYGECGGCAFQHVEFSAQVALKQRIFEEQLQRIGKIMPEQIAPPIYGQAWHYRHRTRLTVAVENQQIQLGYQAKRSHRLTAIDACLVLPQSVSQRLPQLRDFLNQLFQAVPNNPVQSLQIHVAPQTTAITLHSRHALPEATATWFQHAFPEWSLWFQHQGTEVYPAQSEAAQQLFYRLDEFGLTMPYRPNDFTQINSEVNELMVRRAIQWLDPQKNEIIADLFCGLGNFSLPLAKRSHQVIGIEGSATLTQRASENAQKNGLNNVRFHTADLFDTNEQTVRSWGKIDKMLIDPPRAGAYALVQALTSPFLPKRIVYVSCNPATFARDAAILVEKGYRFTCAGIMNMFAQTAHVEAIACFDLN